MEDNHINEEGTVLEEGIVQIEEETVTEEVRETAGEDAARQPVEKKENIIRAATTRKGYGQRKRRSRKRRNARS